MLLQEKTSNIAFPMGKTNGMVCSEGRGVY